MTLLHEDALISATGNQVPGEDAPVWMSLCDIHAQKYYQMQLVFKCSIPVCTASYMGGMGAMGGLRLCARHRASSSSWRDPLAAPELSPKGEAVSPVSPEVMQFSSRLNTTYVAPPTPKPEDSHSMRTVSILPFGESPSGQWYLCVHSSGDQLLGFLEAVI